MATALGCNVDCCVFNKYVGSWRKQEILRWLQRLMAVTLSYSVIILSASNELNPRGRVCDSQFSQYSDGKLHDRRRLGDRHSLHVQEGNRRFRLILGVAPVRVHRISFSKSIFNGRITPALVATC